MIQRLRRLRRLGAVFALTVITGALLATAAAALPSFEPSAYDFGEWNVGEVSPPIQLILSDPEGLLADPNDPMSFKYVGNSSENFPGAGSAFQITNEVCDAGWTLCTYDVAFAPIQGGLHTWHLDYLDAATGELLTTLDFSGTGVGDVPPPVVPEVPFTGLLAVSAIAMFGLGFVILRRRANHASAE